jgi:hypothetical protein
MVQGYFTKIFNQLGGGGLLSFQLSFSLEGVAPQLHSADRLVKWRMMVPPHHLPQPLAGPSCHLDRPASDHPARLANRPTQDPLSGGTYRFGRHCSVAIAYAPNRYIMYPVVTRYTMRCYITRCPL